MISNYRSLLLQVNSLQDKYRTISEITGEDFNVFKILKLQASETRLHSAFLAELLSPLGSHIQKSRFLELFVSKVIAEEFDFDITTAKVRIEQHIGFINEEKTKGGRLDIAIKDARGNEILIENKIYAGDQENQLLRYHHYNPKAKLLYLGLDTRRVSEFSCGHLKEFEHFQVITYKDDISSWLELCRKEAASFPILRESITQYINLIKLLTGQNTNSKMNSELATLLSKDKENLESSWAIANALDAACDLLLGKFKLQCEEIGTELGLEFEFGINWSKRYSGFFFWDKDWKDVCIGFEFQGMANGLIFGIRWQSDDYKNKEKASEYFDKLNVNNIGHKTDCWPYYENIESPLDNWDNKEPWLGIIDGTLKEYIFEKIKSIKTILID
ncbi:PD-(D/E)XK nuclease family protein [Pedobacter sp. BG31]|uniref:PDDEXK-like family protein n=1 Tax=Pedobacter sp. BG31 TaxID=3349697 RepID=UPI0035F4F952